MALLNARRPAAVYELVEEAEFFATAESGIEASAAAPRDETPEPREGAHVARRARPRPTLRGLALMAIAAAGTAVGVGLSRPTTPAPREQTASNRSAPRRPAPEPRKRHSIAWKRSAERPRIAPARAAARKVVVAARSRPVRPEASAPIARPVRPTSTASRPASPPRATTATGSDEFGFEQ